MESDQDVVGYFRFYGGYQIRSNGFGMSYSDLNYEYGFMVV